METTKITRKARKLIALQSQVKCFWCQKDIQRLKDLSRDHVIPRAFQRLADAPDNIVYSCLKCNTDRGRIHDYYRFIETIDLYNRPACHKAYMKYKGMKKSFKYWAKLEYQRLGWSFTATLKLSELTLFAKFNQDDFR